MFMFSTAISCFVTHEEHCLIVFPWCLYRVPEGIILDYTEVQTTMYKTRSFSELKLTNLFAPGLEIIYSHLQAKNK